ncbi:MAG: putative manganese-dependent inorganic diphosphatase, partial [Clostridia bacterium]
MDRDTIYIFGHKNPDTDSICAAIGYAELKRKLGYRAEACRLGELNDETRFVLDYFKVPVPQKISNVRRQVSDLDLDIVDKLSPDVSIKIAWHIMEKSNIRTLPIVDDAQKLLGLVSLTNITDKYMDAFDYTSISNCGTKIDNILETINGEIAAGNRHDFQSMGKVVVAACLPDSYGDYIEKGDIVIVGNRGDSQLKALELGANTIIITCGFKPEEAVREKAESLGALIISTAYDTYTTVRLINQSIPVSSIMTADQDHNIVKFCIDDYIEDIRESMTKNRYRSYPILDKTGVVLGFISRYHLISHRKKKVILLDHNEKGQTVKGIEEAEILEIIDHHKVGDLTTASPILFKNEPVGSTATIIAN